jgi:dienelactone hydrolase
MSGLSRAVVSFAAAVGMALPTAASSQLGRLPTRAITVRSVDGRMVSAVYAEAAQRPAPAVVLVPMLGRSKEDWDGLIERLVDANIAALAVDLPATVLPGTAAEARAWHGVVGGAIDYLFSRPEVRGSAIGVAGASLGATLAAVAAADDARIRSLVLISPALDYRGVSIEGALKAYGERPALLLASRGDPYAARSARELAAAPGLPERPGGIPRTGIRELLWSDTPAHGTVLLARQPDLTRTLVEWFQRTLG